MDYFAKHTNQKQDTDAESQVLENDTYRGCIAGFQSFAGETTFHGIKNLSQKGISTVRRIIWLILLISITSFSFVIIGVSLSKYLRYDTVTSVYEVLHEDMEFPTLLFCNFNMQRRQRMWQYYPDIAAFEEAFFTAPTDDAVPDSDAHQSTSPVPPTTTTRMNNSADSIPSMPYDIIARLRNITLLEFFTRVGYTVDEMFVSCTLGYLIQTFDCRRYMRPNVLSFGMCYSFHSRDVVRDYGPIKVRQTGQSDGLSFVLNVAPHEYSRVSVGKGYGYFMSIYNAKQKWQDDNSNVAISLGTHNLVAIEKNVRTILGKPYSEENCVSATQESDDYYTKNTCLLECAYKLRYNSIDGCSCDIEAGEGEPDQCTLYDMYFCAYVYIGQGQGHNEALDACHCPYACSETTYNYYISTTTYPNEMVEDLARSENWQYQNISDIRANYASVQVYYRSLAETITEEKPEMLVSDLFANIGGQLGLCVGASLITIAEFLEFVVVTTYNSLQKKKARQATTIKVQPMP